MGRFGRVALRGAGALGVALLSLAVAADEQSQFDFANGLFSRGFYAEAVEEYVTYLADYPNGKDRHVALYRLGESQSGAGDYREAFKTFEKLLQSAESSEELKRRATLRQGVSLYQLKEYDEAAVALASITGEETEEPIRVEALYFLGKLHFEAGRREASIKAFEVLFRAASDNPLVPYARYQVAFVHLEGGDLEKAATAFSEAAGDEKAEDGVRMESRFRAAEIYDRLGWFEASVKAYAQLKSDFPGTDYEKRAIYGFAWSLYHSGRYEAAIEAADDYLDAYSNSPRTVGVAYLRGNCLQQQKRIDEAFEAYRGIVSESPDSDFAKRAQYKIAWLHYLNGDKVEAKQEVSKFLASSAGLVLEGDGTFLMGSLLYEEEDFEGALQHFERVVSEYPEVEFAAEAMYKGAECLVRLDRLNKAAAMFERFVALYPDNPLVVDASLRAGDSHFVGEEFEKAAEIYAKILKARPRAHVREQALYRVALARHNAGDSADSAASFRILLEEFPTSDYRIEAHLRIGDFVLRERGEAVEAMEHFKTAYDAEPKGPMAGRALKGLALARLESKDFEGAAATLSQLIAAYEDVKLSPETYAWLGQHRFDHEEWSDAARAFDNLLALSPDYPKAPLIAFKSAEAHERNGDADKALRGYQVAISIAGASSIAVEAQYRMAKIHESASRLDKALALYETAANANSGDAAARSRFRLGAIYEGKEEYEAAARHFMRVAILFLHEELSPEALWRAGLCFEKSGDSTAALSTFSEVVRDFPESEQAAKAKARLKKLAGS